MVTHASNGYGRPSGVEGRDPDRVVKMVELFSNLLLLCLPDGIGIGQSEAEGCLA